MNPGTTFLSGTLRPTLPYSSAYSRRVKCWNSHCCVPADCILLNIPTLLRFAMSLTIVNAAPKRVGLRREDYICSSLHPDVRQPPENKPRSHTPEDIYADPKSSDDEPSTNQDEADVDLSDGSLTGVVTKKNGKSQPEIKGKSRGRHSPKEGNVEGAAAPLQIPPSHFASTVFTSTKPLETRTGSQSSQKRPIDEMDDEMGSFGSSQSKKAKIKTYGGSSNIHKGSAVEQKKPTKTAPAKKRDEPPAYRPPNAEAAARRKNFSNLGL